MATPCKTCPFLIENQDRKHASGWYKKSNLKRLWNGLRRGDAFGMICHSTDPNAIDYGGEKSIAAGHERECVGANTLIQVELNHLAAASSLRDYRHRHPRGLTRSGAIHWVERICFKEGDMEIGDPSDCRLSPP